MFAVMAGWALALAVALAAFGCASMREADIRTTEDMLAAAGISAIAVRLAGYALQVPEGAGAEAMFLLNLMEETATSRPP